jgi:hypothetical protein
MTPGLHNELNHCHECWYNLTGLTTNRCPECGVVIDPDVVRAVANDMQEALSPLDARWAFKKLMIVPAACWAIYLVIAIAVMAAGMASRLLPEPAITLFIYVGGLAVVCFAMMAPFIALCFGVEVGGRIAAKLARRASKPITSFYYAAIFVSVSFLLLTFQIAVAALPLFVLAMLFGIMH